MLRTTFASSRALRVCALGLVTITTAILISSESADARRYKHRRHHVVRESYSPQFSSIIVDANSGATLLMLWLMRVSFSVSRFPKRDSRKW